jgi:hypothetical protein
MRDFYSRQAFKSEAGKKNYDVIKSAFLIMSWQLLGRAVIYRLFLVP